MHLRPWIGISAVLWLLVCTGCDSQPTNLTAAGASPAVKTPVGPVPGPGKQAALAHNPYADNPIALTEGRKLFVRYNCAGCHGDHSGGGMGPSLRDPDWIYSNSDAHIFASIAEGRAHGMPAWGTKVPEDQIWQLVAYIRALGTLREPQPPQ
jgi:cytochrome c oxidase cbb3-type subunit 3